MRIKIIELVTIVAIIVGPILAVQIQKLIERYTEQKDRKLNILRP